jgi:phenylalanyl-tRNA synthetase beta chain
MKYSYQWLQEHLENPLPAVDELVRMVTIKSFEVEGTDVLTSGDTILDIKVLPDRAHDALSHRGMAREIAALFGQERKERKINDMTTEASVPAIEINITDQSLCPRYIGVRVDGIKIEASPKMLATKIAAIGGRSISNIVDLTNFVLFDIGQPMHAFDANKVVRGITVRLAKAGETMTTLDNKTLALCGTELVIADDEGVLALAGIKGGKKAEVDSKTTSVIFESANFDPTLTRKTSTMHGIKTDASKRYENGMTSAFAMEGMRLILSELIKISPTAKVGKINDVYPVPAKRDYHIDITIVEINRLLGSKINAAEMDDVLKRLGFLYTHKSERYTVDIPVERLDLRIKQDLIEEIGRNYGYDKIDSTLPKISHKGIPHKRLHYATIVRSFLIKRGYSEVFTYSFAIPKEGEVEVLNPVGNDRPFMRQSLAPGIERALTSNFYNAPLLELEDIKIFELGNVFGTNGERMMLAIGAIGGTKKRWKILKEEFATTAEKLLASLNAGVSPYELSEGIQGGKIEIDFDSVIEKLPDPTTYEPLFFAESNVRYTSLSPYPFIVRDIAIFVPQDVTEDYIEKLLKNEAGDLVVRFSQFDKFQKPDDERISYGYRLVFQSFERTLTDEEVNTIMERVTAVCNCEKDWQVR